MPTNSLEIEILAKDSTAAGTTSARRQFQGVEQEAARAAAAASRALPGRDAMGRFMAGASREAAGLAGALGGVGTEAGKTGEKVRVAASSIAAFERQAAMYGARGIERIRVRADIMRQAAGNDEAALQRINAAQARAEQRERARAAAAVASSRQITQAKSSIDSFADSATSASMRLTVLSVPLALGANRAIQMSSALEQARISFTTLLGSKEKADDFVASLQTFALRTPFNLMTLVEQSRYLLATGFKGNEILPTLTAFGNAVSAGGGGDEVLQRVLLQVGQIKAKGKAGWQDLRLMAEAGIPVVDILAKSIQGKGEPLEAAQARVFKELEAGNFKAGPTLAVLQQSLMGQYGGMLEKQSLSQRGALSNLKDQADKTFAAIGDGMAPTVKKFAAGAMNLLGWVQGLAAGFSELPQPIKHVAVAVGGLTIISGPMLFFLGSMATLIGPAIRGWQMLRMAMAGISGLSLFTNIGGPTLFLNSVQGPLTLASTRMLWFAKAVGGVTAAFAGWEVGRWLRDVTGLGAVMDKAWEPVLNRFGYTTQENAGVPIVGNTKEFIGGYQTRLKRKGIPFPVQGELSDDQYLNTLMDIAKLASSSPGSPLGGGGGGPDLKADRKRAHELIRSARNREYNGNAIADAFATYGTNLEEFGTSPQARRDIGTALEMDLQREAHKELRKNAADTLKSMDEEGDKRRDYDTKRYQDGLKFEADTIQRELETIEKRRAMEQDALEDSRGLALQSLDAVQAQTLASKVALEDQKLAIEQEYAQRALGIQLARINAERSGAIAKARGEAAAAGVSPDERIAAIDEAYNQQIAAAQDAAQAAEIKRARQTAIDKAKMQIDENRRIFDSMKDQANGLLDQMLSKTRNIGDAIKGVLKAAFLTPLKDAASTQIARIMTGLVTGEKVGLETATVTGTGPLAGLRRVFARLGVGAKPVFGGGGLEDVKLVNNAVPVMVMNAGQAGQQAAQAATSGLRGAPGGLLRMAAGVGALGLGLGALAGGGAQGATGGGKSAVDAVINYAGGGSEAVSFGGGGLSSVVGGPGGTSGFAGPVGGKSGGILGGLGMGGGLKNFFGFGSSSVGWAGNATTTATLGGKLTALGTSSAALLGGATLAGMGLMRGGLSGLGMTTAGGALMGFKFGGPIGAAIGAAAGFGAGLIRMFVKGATEKAREKIKAAYGLDVTDKGVLKQIVEISKQSYGGNLDMAIRSPQVKELLELYAMSTGQGFGTQAKLRPVSLSQTGTGLVQNEIYENGRALAFSGAIGARTSADIIPGNAGGLGMPTNYAGGPTQINLTLNPAQTMSVFEGRTVSTIANSPRVVQTASNNAQKGNFGRREQAALLFEPGVLTA